MIPLTDEQRYVSKEEEERIRKYFSQFCPSWAHDMKLQPVSEKEPATWYLCSKCGMKGY